MDEPEEVPEPFSVPELVPVPDSDEEPEFSEPPPDEVPEDESVPEEVPEEVPEPAEVSVPSPELCAKAEGREAKIKKKAKHNNNRFIKTPQKTHFEVLIFYTGFNFVSILFSVKPSVDFSYFCKKFIQVFLCGKGAKAEADGVFPEL